MNNLIEVFLLAWQGALVKSQVFNFHISLGTQEHQIIKSTLLTSHILPASVLPTGRHLLLGYTQEVKSAGREILHISADSLFMKWFHSFLPSIVFWTCSASQQVLVTQIHFLITIALNIYSRSKYFLNN